MKRPLEQKDILLAIKNLSSKSLGNILCSRKTRHPDSYGTCSKTFRWLRLAVSFLLLVGIGSPAIASETQQLNVLFIAVDDLRPDLGCYGHPVVESPNIDRLASSGTLFQRAYCQQAICNSSRASLMTGLRPETIGVYDLEVHFRDIVPNVVTLSQYFIEQGYHAQCVGKVYHLGQGNHDDALSWTVQEKFGVRSHRYGPEGKRYLRDRKNRDEGPLDRRNGLPWEAPEIADEKLTDGVIATSVIELMRRHKDEPFFLAAGFVNPHLPFVSPKKYWDKYDRDAIDLPTNPHPPEGSPRCATTNWGELRNYYGMPEKREPLSDEQARAAIHGYWAAVSYVDAQVGRLLDELDRLGLREKTVVILWGDHGWQLGEHGFWCKHTNYEVAARAPLILSLPGQKNPGSVTNSLVEFVDIYPTLVEACGLPAREGLDGISLFPLVENPKRPWKSAAFHIFPRGEPSEDRLIGRTIRTDRYRLVEWATPSGNFLEIELYDQKNDPDENTNLAEKPEYATTVESLLKRLHTGWKNELPVR